MMTTLTEKQSILVKACHDSGQLTSHEAYDLLKKFYLIKHTRHISDIINRMVREGILQRVNPGTYRLPGDSPYKDQQQSSLFTNQTTKP